MNLTDLTKKLVSVPSFVDKKNNESQLGTFIFDYLQDLGYLTIKKQPVEGNRFNIVAHDGHPPRLMFCCHMDTVQPSGIWEHDEFAGDIEGDRLYGLGACDMKGGTAALLHALRSIEQTKGLFLLFDVDEEYYFKGMLKFLEEYEIHPALAVFPEPGLKISNGHRGLIEVSFKVHGKSAHAARPELGKNAILGASRAVETLMLSLEEFQHPVLGKTACNLAWLKGGIDLGEGEIGCQANKIPDLVEIILDIRPAQAELRAQRVIEILSQNLSKNGYFLKDSQVKLDFGSLYIDPGKLKIFENVVKSVVGEVEYEDISLGGYGEGQLLNERLGTDCVYFGPGPKKMAHQMDEYVSIAELQLASEVFKVLIDKYCVRDIVDK